MNRLRSLSPIVPLMLLGLGLAGGTSGLAAASSATISRAFQGDNSITLGSLVSLDPAKDNYVQAATTSTANKLVGVVVGNNDSLVAIDSDNNRLQIAISGVANALVSDLNGDVKSGDQIAVSPYNGVGMKADYGSRLIGLAQSGLSDKGVSLTTREVTDKYGKHQTIKVGYVRVGIAIGSAAAKPPTAAKNGIQNLANSLTGHNVSTARIVLSSLIAIIALVALVTLMYTSGYGTIVAVGRNPLAKTAIFKALLTVFGLVLITAVVALGTIYLIVR